MKNCLCGTSNVCIVKGFLKATSATLLTIFDEHQRSSLNIHLLALSVIQVKGLFKMWSKMPLTQAKGLSKVLYAFRAGTTRLNFSLVLLLASQPFIVFHTIHIFLAFSSFKFYLSFVALYTKDAIISMLLIIVIIDYKGK